MPRFVSVVVTHGRSVPVSIGGKMRRLAVGDKPALIPFEIYVRYAHKLRLVETDGSLGMETTAVQGEDVAGIEAEAPVAPAPLPAWPMRVGPEEYLALYEKRKNPSKTMTARLDLARAIIAAKGDHGKT